MKLLILLALIGFTTATSAGYDVPVVVDTPVNEKVGDETPVAQDDISVVLPEAPEPIYEAVDMGMILVPESVMEELRLMEDGNTIHIVENSEDVPLDTVRFVDFAEDAHYEPVAAGELESLRVNLDEFPTGDMPSDTVHVVDLPVFENLPPRYPDPTWR